MTKIVIACFLGFFLSVSPVRAEGASSVDAMVEDLRTMAKAADYEGFIDVLDPLGQWPEPNRNQLASLITTFFEGQSTTVDIMIRSKSTEAGERVLISLWRETKYLHAALVLHQRPEGWTTLDMKMNSDVEAVLHYF